MPTIDPTLSRFAHDRAALNRSDNQWLAQAWTRGRVLVINDKFEVPILELATGPVIQWRDPADFPPDQTRIFLGLLGDVPMFMTRGKRDIKADDWGDLRNIGELLPVADSGLLVEAVGLAQWHERHIRCPICGTETEWSSAGWSTTCPNDGTQHFPRTDPAVIMLVHDGADRCVLGRQAIWPAGRFSILAGFVEPGESAEAAVAREVAEEVGLEVTDIQYVGSQPWPFPASIMLGFTARVVGDQEIRFADDEIDEAHWFSKEDMRNGVGLASSPSGVSIAHHIIHAWLDGKL